MSSSVTFRRPQVLPSIFLLCHAKAILRPSSIYCGWKTVTILRGKIQKNRIEPFSPTFVSLSGRICQVLFSSFSPISLAETGLAYVNQAPPLRRGSGIFLRISGCVRRTRIQEPLMSRRKREQPPPSAGGNVPH